MSERILPKNRKRKTPYPPRVLEKQFRFIDFVTSRHKLNNIPMFDLYKYLVNETFIITDEKGEYEMD